MQLTKRQKFWMVVTLLCGSFTTAFSETLLNNGLPTIMREVGVSEMTVQWLSTGYMLIAGMTMPLAAYLLNSFKLKRLFTSTMSIFLLGSVIAACAPNFPILLIGRLIEGIAVGVNMPLIPSVLSLIYPANKRGTVMGLSGIIINIGPAIGPTVSGLIVDHYSWRMLFIILIPISLLIIIATQFAVKNVVQAKTDQLDWLSIFTATGGLGLLLYSLGLLGQTGQLTWQLVLMQAIGLIIVAYFVRRQFKLKKPLLEMRVYQAPSFRLGALLALLNTSSLMATELMLPLFNQNILKVTPTVSGLMLIPSAVVMGIVSPIAGRLYDEVGIKKIAVIGMGIGLLGTLPMILYSAKTAPAAVTLLYALRCGGLNLAYAPLTVYALNALPTKYVVFGSTLIVNMNQIADAFANAMAATMQALGQKAGSAAGMTSLAASSQGYHWSFAAICVLNALAFILVFWLHNKSKVELIK
ncbi:MAG: DHA2 family efflux MFS transporter permease subunit [Lactobacillus sp.]|jgi:EmrB/QacA subfamily drug resistance transporter|nr:DHA2 family efflux MFS transporter permease subunit [Lactobacillus sp.]